MFKTFNSIYFFPLKDAFSYGDLRSIRSFKLLSKPICCDQHTDSTEDNIERGKKRKIMLHPNVRKLFVTIVDIKILVAKIQS